MNRNDTPQLLEYLRAVKSRWLLIAVLAVLAVAASLAVSLTSPKQYDARVDILLREQEPANTLLDPGATSSSAIATRSSRPGSRTSSPRRTRTSGSPPPASATRMRRTSPSASSPS